MATIKNESVDTGVVAEIPFEFDGLTVGLGTEVLEEGGHGDFIEKFGEENVPNPSNAYPKSKTD